MNVTEKSFIICDNGLVLVKDMLVEIRTPKDCETTEYIKGRVIDFDEDHLVLDCSTDYHAKVKTFKNSLVYNIRKVI